MFKKHNSYNEFENNVDPYIIKYLRKHKLMEYVADHYKENNMCDIVVSPGFIKVPINTETYLKLNEFAHSCNKTVVQVVSEMIENIGGK